MLVASNELAIPPQGTQLWKIINTNSSQPNPLLASTHLNLLSSVAAQVLGSPLSTGTTWSL